VFHDNIGLPLYPQYLANFGLFFQKNEAGNSLAMEYEGFKRSMDNLLKRNIPISTFVSDRHPSIAKHMWEKHKDITHYFDLWHLIKSKNNQTLLGFSKAIRSWI
jgi:hypothetical protein